MKASVPVTVSDLEATAKDDKRGVAEYLNVKVWWDDATNNYLYWYKGTRLAKSQIEAVLIGYK